METRSSRCLEVWSFVVLLGSSSIGGAGEPALEVCPPHSVVEGKSIGEWGAEFWKWVFSLPKPRNPLVTNYEQIAQAGQDGPVFFTAATGQGEQTHRISVPAGKYILFSLLNCTNFNDPTTPPLTIPELVKGCHDAITLISTMTVTLDGEPYPKVFDHLEDLVSFTLELPENNLNDLPAGTYGPAIHEGYFLMIKPPSSGEHKLRLRGFVGDPDPARALYWLDVTYVVTVVSPEAHKFLRADSDGDGTVDITDPIKLLGYLFLGETGLACEDAADAQDDGRLDLTDAIYALNFLFLGGGAPSAPGPAACGADPMPRDILFSCIEPCGG